MPVLALHDTTSVHACTVKTKWTKIRTFSPLSASVNMASAN